MEQLVRNYMGEARLPSHKQACVKGEEVDVLALRKSLKNLLSSVIVEGCEMIALTRLKRLTRPQGESNLDLVHRA